MSTRTAPVLTYTTTTGETFQIAETRRRPVMAIRFIRQSSGELFDKDFDADGTDAELMPVFRFLEKLEAGDFFHDVVPGQSRTAQETLIAAHDPAGALMGEKQVAAAAALVMHHDLCELTDVLERIANALDAQGGI